MPWRELGLVHWWVSHIIAGYKEFGRGTSRLNLRNFGEESLNSGCSSFIIELVGDRHTNAAKLVLGWIIAR